MDSIESLRDRPFDVTANGQPPLMAHVRVPAGTVKVGVTREDAAEFLDSSMFTGGIVVLSFSAWSDRERRELHPAEAGAVVHQLLGPSVPTKLREVALGAGALYLAGLVDATSFVSPMPLQDAYLSKRLGAAPLFR